VQKKTFAVGAGLAVLAAVASQAGSASAQEGTAIQSPFGRTQNVSVLERPRPELEALGLRSGGFLIFPKASLSEAYEDNVFASETNRQTDWITSFAPSLVAESQWSRHQLQAHLSADTFRYANFSTQNNTTYSAGAAGRLDVVNGTAITGGIAYDRLVEPRTAASALVNERDPVKYDQIAVDLGGQREVNRFKLTAAAHYRSYDFKNNQAITGGVINEQYRNNQTWEESVRADYAVSPALAVYATAVHNSWNFHAPLTRTDVDRDASGYQVAAGVDFEVTRLVRGQIQAGYLDESFKDARVGDASGLGFLGKVEYFPTQLLTLTFNAARQVNPTGLIGAAGALHSEFGAQADYELLRNLILSASAHRLHDDYRGLDRTDNIWTGQLGANYLINRRIGLNLIYNYYNQKSEGLARGLNFAVNRVQLGVVVQY
jgi:hypothetical protein